jgi:hypothetical protein
VGVLLSSFPCTPWSGLLCISGGSGTGWPQPESNQYMSIRSRNWEAWNLQIKMSNCVICQRSIYGDWWKLNEANISVRGAGRNKSLQNVNDIGSNGRDEWRVVNAFTCDLHRRFCTNALQISSKHGKSIYYSLFVLPNLVKSAQISSNKSNLFAILSLSCLSSNFLSN